MSQCNYTAGNSPPGTAPSLESCIYNNIESISLEQWEVHLPKQPPRCGTALEMYCPHTKNGRLECLNCIVRNQNLLSNCDSISEERWCDRSNFNY